MTEENTENNDAGVSIEELKGLFEQVVTEKLDERGLTSERINKLDIFDSLEGLFEKHKGSSGVDKDSLLTEIGTLIDSKLSGVTSGGSNGGGNKEKREPKLRIFG